MSVDPARILVAVPIFDEAFHIAATLHALMADRPEMERVDIVVADGGSTDGTQAIVAELSTRNPNIRLIDNPGRLQSAAVNRVVEICAEDHHDILVRVDAHAYYPPGYVLDVARALQTRRADALATVMDSGGESCFQRGAAWATDTKVGSGGSGHRGGGRSGWVDHGHHAGFSLPLFRRLGGYDIDFLANEDAELDHRIGLAGGRIWLEAGIRLGYVMRSDLRGLARQYWRYGRGRAQTVTKHRMRPRLRQMVPPLAVLGNGAALILAPVLPILLIVPASYLVLLAAVTVQLLMRHRSVCALWAGPALAVMHHAWGAGFISQMLRGRTA
ncbi:succinoglycan biosynthesis protein ExoA [Jannaschia faecimaris]|uniref:Succinoglycan biosynthesis protein ExoA n=1 Tax=Jannaschia faecimaris TaxID=1244108 RepID=A0A1H3UGH9_9RHOB|nr:glycosyltransferase family 2 protein [Jannaschia faecimaris]SDZ61494.1 succinoglycan biosynthesis protein ExoA [Jannaschia faecimaris]